MLNCAVCGRALYQLESEFNGNPVHNTCLDRAIVQAAFERMKYVPIETPDWMRHFIHEFAEWKYRVYG